MVLVRRYFPETCFILIANELKQSADTMNPIHTIQDVARESGVSVTSVSNYINGRHGEMREQTRARIAKAIKALGYVPNSAARQLKTGQSPILGLLVPTVVNPFFGELAVALEVTAQEKGFRLILCNTQRRAEDEIAFVRELLSYGAKGILATSVLQNARTMSTLIKQGAAFVLFEAQSKLAALPKIDVVSMDNLLATQKAVDYLVTLGHSRIVYATVTPLTPHRQLREEGFLLAMQRHSIEKNGGNSGGVIIRDQDLQVRFSSHNDKGLVLFGRAAAQHILQISPRPTAVIALNDQIALGMMFAFLEMGVRVPDEISVVGIDDVQFASFSYPTLTSVRQPYAEIAKTALESVCARLADPLRPGNTFYFEPSLIARNSTGICPRA